MRHKQHQSLTLSTNSTIRPNKERHSPHNYPINSISTTSRRYERDRLRAPQMKPPRELAILAHSNGKTTTTSYLKAPNKNTNQPHCCKERYNLLHIRLTKGRTKNEQSNCSYLVRMAYPSRQSSPAISTNNRRSFCQYSCRNMRKISISTFTIIAFFIVANEGRIFCDKYYNHHASTIYPNQAQALIPFQNQVPFNHHNHQSAFRRSMEGYSPALPHNLANQLMFLLSPIMNVEQQMDYNHQLRDHHNKHIAISQQDFNKIYSQHHEPMTPTTSVNINNQSSQLHHHQDNPYLPVTTTPVTATLMAPNSFQPVTLPSTLSDQFDGDNKIIPDNHFLAELLTASSQNDISRLTPVLASTLEPDSKPPLVYSSNDISNIREPYEKHDPVSPLMHLLPMIHDQGYMMASASSPVVVARNSVSSTSSSSTEKSKRRLRSLLEKNQQQGSQAAASNPAKARGVLWEMATDPSLMVTLFHMMDRASFALPLGFLLMPLIKMIKSPPGSGLGLARLLPARASHRSVDYEELAKRIDYVDKLLSKALRPSHRSEPIGK